MPIEPIYVVGYSPARPSPYNHTNYATQHLTYATTSALHRY
jgi:hypothetical protein